MSGHSKWATIHRKKGLIDAERGKVFQKLAKEIMVAAKGTNGDIDTNASLRAVVEKARGQNMPKDNIMNAIKKVLCMIRISMLQQQVFVHLRECSMLQELSIENMSQQVEKSK